MRLAALHLGQRPQEGIDRHVRAAGRAPRHELQHPVGEDDVLRTAG